MPPRSIATATLSFGLVSVPVNIYASAESSARVSFNWLNKKTGRRVKQQYYDPDSGENVQRSEMIKGYEFQKGQYVTFTDEELKALEAKATQTIEIAEFIPADQVERLYLDRAYYLGPDKGGDRAYRLLSAALRETGRAALARYAARGKQYLVMIRPKGEGLVMEQLHYADEIKPFGEVPVGEAEVKEDELKLAKQLVEQAASDNFHPEKYKDDVRERVLENIQRKVDGEDITTVSDSQPQTKIIDLMEALKASLAATQSGESAAAEAGQRKPAEPAHRVGDADEAIKKKAS